MYSRTRFVTDSHEATMQKGIRNAVSSTKGIDTPSTPSW